MHRYQQQGNTQQEQWKRSIAAQYSVINTSLDEHADMVYEEMDGVREMHV